MICIAWGGMPAYAAAAAGQFVVSTEKPVCLVATSGDVPKTSGNRIAGSDVHWVTDNDSRSLKEVLGELPMVLVVSGWFIPSFNRFVDEVNAAGGKAIALCDNRYNFSPRQILWVLYFRLMIAPRFAGYMVPGRSGFQLLRFAGIPAAQIRMGMYTADPAVFHDGLPLHVRSKRMIFVGRFDERKNVLLLLRAFIAFTHRHSDWTLDCYGQGPLQGEMESLVRATGSKAVNLHPFAQPDELSECYRQARVMILPSLEDHWGVVVHEAALSGCALVLSTHVGAAADFINGVGCSLFPPKSEKRLGECLDRIAGWDDDQWLTAQKSSLAAAALISPAKFSEHLSSLIKGL